MKTMDVSRFIPQNVTVAAVIALCLYSAGEPVLAQESRPVTDQGEHTLTGQGNELNTGLFGDLLIRAMDDNPGIDMADARTDQATELVRQNGAYRFPKMDLFGAYGPEHNDPAPSSETGHAATIGRNLKLTVSKLLFDGGSSRSEFYRSKRLEGAAQAEAHIVVEDLFREIARYYIDYWRYQQELTQADEFVSTMQDLVNDLDAMYRGGAASKLEVDFARARMASARSVSSSANASQNNAFSEIEYLVPGLLPFAALSPESFIELRLLPLADYAEQGAATNSGFVTNQMSVEATQLRIAAQKGRYLPTLEFELSASLIDDEGGPSMQRDKAAAKLFLSYNLYSGGDRRGGVRRAEAQLRELEAERAQLERDVFRTIDQSFNSITAARLTLNAVNDEISANQELQRLNRKNLALGTINIIELIDVEERLFNAYSRKNEVIATMYQEYIDLVISAGFTQELLDKYQAMNNAR